MEETLKILFSVLQSDPVNTYSHPRPVMSMALFLMVLVLTSAFVHGLAQIPDQIKSVLKEIDPYASGWVHVPPVRHVSLNTKVECLYLQISQALIIKLQHLHEKSKGYNGDKAAHLVLETQIYEINYKISAVQFMFSLFHQKAVQMQRPIQESNLTREGCLSTCLKLCMCLSKLGPQQVLQILNFCSWPLGI